MTFSLRNSHGQTSALYAPSLGSLAVNRSPRRYAEAPSDRESFAGYTLRDRSYGRVRGESMSYEAMRRKAG